MSTFTEKCLDSYEANFGHGPEAEQRLFDEVKEMEANSKWEYGIGSKSLSLSPISAPIFAEDVARTYGLDVDLAKDTSMDSGTHLVLHRFYNGASVWAKCVRSTARNSLYETAKLNGTALGRMGADKLAETLNNGLAVAKGTSIILERYGKISAVHSDAAGGYKVMPISELLDIVKEEVGTKFGRMIFKKGHNQHSYTSAIWYLPDAKNALTKAYATALSNAVSNRYDPQVFMPAIRFFASDTAASAARVIPLFVSPNGYEIRLVDGVQVRHERKAKKETQPTPTGNTGPVAGQQSLFGPTVTANGLTGVVLAGMSSSTPKPSAPAADELDGVDLFRKEVKNLYAMFTDAVKKAGELSKVEIWNGENCIVSLCKKFSISKKYGDAAREEVRNLTLTLGPDECLSAHDIYLAMNRVVTEAVQKGATTKAINFHAEAVAKVLSVTDWSEHDVGGVVAWKE